jgi:hypothetical protein
MRIQGDVISDADLEKCVVSLESFMVRRFMCDLTPKNYNRFFLTVLSRAKDAERNDVSVADAIIGELKRSTSETTVWPTDKQFKEGWMSKALYVRSRPDRSAMILKALQSKMKTSRNESLELIGSLSVEHLLPQQADLKDYPYASVGLDGDYTWEEYRKDMMDAVGNLTLLTGPLNSSVSNGPFHKKIEAICADSDLRLNAWLRTTELESWDEVEIEKRSKKLFTIAQLVWPAP